MRAPQLLAVSQALFLCGLPVSAAAQGAIIPLREGWVLQSAAKVAQPGEEISDLGFMPKDWYPTTVPRTVLAALVDNGVYPDPYYGLNLKSIPGYRPGMWHVMPEDSPFRDSWWYRSAFDLGAELAGRFLTLHFDGINYEANIWLNGKLVAGSETVRGMFRRFEFPINSFARFGGKNVLAVEIIPPGLLPDKDYGTRRGTPRPKQVQATTGWDDHNPQPPDMNMGIWEDVFIRVQGPVALRHPYLETHLDTPSLARAELVVSAYLTNQTDNPVTGVLKGSIEETSFEQEVALAPRETREIFFRPEDFGQLIFENPRVWWPHPAGPQELYFLDLAVSVDGTPSDAERLRFGIRELTSYLNDEKWRTYEVNGQRILIRGGAWMTSDMLLRLTDQRYDALVRYARESNLNMLRSEGFSIRETEEFYNRCDEYGVMVTQQIFGRSIPDEDLAVACIDDMMLRIRSHPSLAHFLGHDETFPTKTLDTAYRDLIERYRVNRSYQPHSGAFFEPQRRMTGGTRTGTRGLWTYASPSYYYLRKRYAAWGFAQSGGIGGIVAPMSSLRQMMPEDQLWPALKTEAWSFHTVTQGAGYFDVFVKAMEACYGPAEDLEDFCNKAYAMNYNSARGMFEAYGRNKYAATGITTWKYDAAWPAAMTWQYVDWYLRATAAYYGAKKACEALHVQYAYDDDTIYVVNGFYEPFDGLEVTAALYDFDMTKRSSRKAVVSVGPDDKAKAFAIDWPDGLSTTHFLKLELRDKAGRIRSDNFYWLSTLRDIPGIEGHTLKGVFFQKPKSQADFKELENLPRVKLNTNTSVETNGDERMVRVTLENPTPALAFLVQLAVTRGEGGLEIGPAYWDTNYFSLLPGETRTVHAVIPETALEGATPALQVRGWNVRP